ncbi:MAG: hypothetical protein RIC55_07460 [Pirellulaceae bacterium]
MYAFIGMLIFALAPFSPVVDDTADVIEINRYFDQAGDQVFQQLIFWEWRETEGAYRVFAWRMIKSPRQIPIFDHWRGGHTIVFLDQGVLRRVHAASIRETWTQHDPELIDRQFVSPDRRRGLGRDDRARRSQR